MVSTEMPLDSKQKPYCKPRFILSVLVGLCVLFMFLASRNFKGEGFKFKFKERVGVGIPHKGKENGDLSAEEIRYRLYDSAVFRQQSRENVEVYKSSSAELETSSQSPALGALLDFDPHGNDTLVVIHTQKTGGSQFINHLITVKKHGKYLCILSPRVRSGIEERKKVPRGKSARVKKKAIAGRKAKRAVQRTVRTVTPCPRDPLDPDGEQWLIAEKTVRWVCGLHASYTEFRHCLPSLDNGQIGKRRRMLYAIFLRHPVLRYLSEYFHVQRNATWVSPHSHMCGEKPVSELDMPPCYPGYYSKKPWVNVTLSAYLSCESNWGNNRQTMMLADLESVNCFSKSSGMSRAKREEILLETAKKNLKGFSFFGLTEYMSESCQLFEETFGVKFAVQPPPRNMSSLHSAPMLSDLWNNTELYNRVLEVNHLDVQLYEFALELFTERARSMGISVNKGLVEQEVEILRTNPMLVDRTIAKFKKLNYSVT